MCTGTITLSISLPLFPLLLITISVLILFSRFITRSVAAHYRIPARSHFVWSTDAPYLLPSTDSLDHFTVSIIKELGVRRHKHAPGSCDQVKCVVCLCIIEEGEEVRELSCEHLFHRACLDRWMAYRHATCPLCRRSLVPSKMAGKEGELEELEEDMIFPFSYLASTSVHGSWWVR